MNAATPLFGRVALIGVGLIGSSLARVIRRDRLARHIAVAARTQRTLDAATRLKFADSTSLDPAVAARGADLVMICTPMSAYAEIARAIAPALKAGAIVSDVGSVKAPVARDVGRALPDGVHLVPGHPIAGTEHSGPEAGSAELFEGRWCILTPAAKTDKGAVEKVTELWRRAGSTIAVMDALHHDRVLAITSHLPHLIAYTIVDTAAQLEKDVQSEVIKFSASGFRDFTRIAASDPVMWRDIFLSNREAVLEILQRFNEDLTALQRAIRQGDGKMLEETFRRTRAIRKGVIAAKQA
ncbi:MAG: prephenate/arogenate dehydrogenase family protein [Rhodospirillales bacterium]|nr:prephenate/arogenate dehydrogenase family protein [Rhodospirillales bacterium]MSP79977.1 prephenate/arogenate dehydrogenase family protein [Rhodospirillales bacterium]